MYNQQTQEEREAERIKAFERTKLALESYRKHLQNQLGATVKIDFVDMPDFADSDYMVFIDNKFNHYLEAKVRYTEKNKYQATKVPLRKHATAEHWLKASGIKSYFLCIWQDEMGLFDLTVEPDTVEDTVARYDRGTSKDVYAFYNVDRSVVITV